MEFTEVTRGLEHLNIGAFARKVMVQNQPLQQFRKPEKVERVLAYLQENMFDSTLSIQEALDACCIKSRSFHSQFKRYTGMTMSAYVRTQRMEIAKRLLRCDSISIFDTALSVGFNYPENFTRAFKKYTGSPPVAYRDKMIGNKNRIK